MILKKKKWYTSNELAKIFNEHLDVEQLMDDGFVLVDGFDSDRWFARWEKTGTEFDVFVLLWAYGEEDGVAFQARTNHTRMLNRYIINRDGPNPDNIFISDEDNYQSVIRAMSADWDENALQKKLLNLLKIIKENSINDYCFLSDKELAEKNDVMSFLIKHDLETLQLEKRIEIIDDEGGRRIRILYKKGS